MSNQHPYVIYDASAGSGKTFTLVKEYLKIIIASSNPMHFKHVLAITFTNKAAGEMKTRIIDMLSAFASDSVLDNPNTMFEVICDELNIEALELHKRSKHLLETIIHNYASFDISTIDGFTHKIIRTFAYDLKLPLNFEVNLDVDALLFETVDRLISKAGIDKELTNTLVSFAIEKADDDKSWDVSRDFYFISKLLVSENDIPFIDTLKDKSLSDFKGLKSLIKSQSSSAENTLVSVSKEIVALIEEARLQPDDFSRGSLPKYFQNLASINFEVKYGLKWQEELINNQTLYPKRVTSEVASTIDAIQSEILDAFLKTKELVLLLNFLNAVYKNLTPLSVLNEISKQLTELKKEQNIMLISEFNSIVNREIKNQPTPFIYERIGEKFKHYFVDEFQDTSVLQWENLTPLLDTSLSAEKGSVMLVGDAKQAIYRWRGGKAEQFIDLYTEKSNPFHADLKVVRLESNYRSYKEIINFNNSFFNYLSEMVFNNDDYTQLYKNVHQKTEHQQEGYVNLSFIDFEVEEDKDLAYSQQVHKTIRSCLENGFALGDICVLVRKKKEGVAIAEYLSAQGLNIMSSETLLINNSPKVRFVVNILKLILQPENKALTLEVLLLLSDILNIENKHAFLKAHVYLDTPYLFKSFNALGVDIKFHELLQLPIYDMVETIIQSFSLVLNSDAYIQYFMDVVWEHSKKPQGDLNTFVEYYDKKADSLSIVTPEGHDAIKIMTIHKSKGLEFPVVIFPFADLNIYREVTPKEWFPLDEKDFNGFAYALLNYSSAFENYGQVGEAIYNRHQSELELDAINLLYVALTRPIEQLYIISKKELDIKGMASEKTYSGFFINYLQNCNIWNNNQLEYSFGTVKKQSTPKPASRNFIEPKEFVSTKKEAHRLNMATNAGYLWDTAQEKALEKGNLIHNIMSLIKAKDDIDFAFSDYVSANTITEEQAIALREIVTQITSHQSLEKYYTSEFTIYNEQDIILKEGQILRPDRLCVNSKNEVIILDYKTGSETNNHFKQLEEYEAILTKMHFKVVKKILIYINDTIEIKEF